MKPKLNDIPAETRHHPAPKKGKYKTSTPVKKLTDFEVDILIFGSPEEGALMEI